jgi:parallel beta-helix repeat protein
MIYHVNALAGDDRHAGSEEGPWRTLQQAAKAARPGDRVIVHRGNYSGAVRITTAGTEWEAAEPDETVINGEWDGRDTRYAPAVLSVEAPRTVVAGFTVTNAPAHGIGLRGAAADVLIKNCRVHDSARSGIRLFGKNLSRNATIVNCTITGSGRAARLKPERHGHGIELTFGHGVMIANCTIVGNAGAGIQVRQGTKGTIVQENTIYDNAGPGIAIHNSPRTAVVDNFIYLTARPRAVKGLRPDGIAIADLPRQGQRYPATRDTRICGNVVANCATLLRVHNEPERKRTRTRQNAQTVIAHNTLVGGPLTQRGIVIEPTPYGAYEPAVFRDNIIHMGHAPAGAPIANENAQPILAAGNAWSKLPPATWASNSDTGDTGLRNAAVVLSGQHPQEDDFAPVMGSSLIGSASDEATVGALEPLTLFTPQGEYHDPGL